MSETSARFRLEGRAALVTGAGRGLGRSIADALADAGAEVWLLARSRDELERAVEAIRAAGGRAVPVACDVTDSGAVSRVIGDMSALDVLVNNAGTQHPRALRRRQRRAPRPPARSERARRVPGRPGGARARCSLTPTARHAGGAIINMSSQMGHVGAVNRSVYCLTKHALEGLTKAMALELAPHGIRVVSVAPTFVETPLTAPMFARARVRQMGAIASRSAGSARSTRSPPPRCSLASPAASLVTGTSLVVDGGWTAQ